MFVVGATLDCIGDGKPVQTNAAADMSRLLPKYRPYARAIDQYTRTYGSINPEPDNDGVMFAAGRSLMLHPQITWFIQKDGKRQAYRVGVWA